MQNDRAGNAPESTTAIDRHIKRRRFLLAAGGMATAGMGVKLYRQFDEYSLRTDVFIAKAASYGDGLERKVRQGLAELGIGRESVARKSVLLKPNLVEPSRDAPHQYAPGHWYARPPRSSGHWAPARFSSPKDRDTAATPTGCSTSRVSPKCSARRSSPFVDLNHDEVFFKPNRMRFTPLRRRGLPAAMKRADIVV